MEYLYKVEIEDMIKELVWNYRQLLLPDITSDGANAAGNARFVRESEQAWSVLEAAFKHEGQFSKELLEDMSDGALERIQNRIVSWTTDMTWPDGGSSGFWKSTATTAEECSEKTSVFMQDRYWPFTKIIRCVVMAAVSTGRACLLTRNTSIYLDAQVLKTGLILADLPGRRSRPLTVHSPGSELIHMVRSPRYQPRQSTSHRKVSHEV